MLTLPQIIDFPEKAIEALQKRNFKSTELIASVLEIYNQKKLIQQSLEEKQRIGNEWAKEIGVLFAQNKIEDAQKIKENTLSNKQEAKTLEAELDRLDKELNDILIKIPNLPHSSVPTGYSAEQNIVIKTQFFTEKSAPQNPLPHWEILESFNLVDFNLGNKITGSGFPVYIGQGAKLQRALTAYFLDKAQKVGYTEIIPPYLVNEDSAYGTGQLPDKEGQMYYTQDSFYLIPTAEVPLTNLLRNSIIEEEKLPIKLVGHSPCFRREAGSYGKEVRGLNRVHQFEKVEIVQITSPENSYLILEEMAAYVETILQELTLPYRQLKLCGGDMGFTSALTYDFEVLALGQNKWLEVSSVSNFETFQSNRLKIRMKNKLLKKNFLVHTLNGSALALPRILAAIIENNYQNNEIIIPEVLVPYTGFTKILSEKNSLY